MSREELDVNAINEDGMTLFYLSCSNKAFDVAGYLLDVGADPNIIPPNKDPRWRFILPDQPKSLHLRRRRAILLDKLRKVYTFSDVDLEPYSKLKELLLFASWNGLERFGSPLPENTTKRYY